MEPITHPSSYKPIILTFEETISRNISTCLEIRHLKYIHKIEFLDKSPHLAKLRTLKRLHSLVALDHSSSSSRKLSRNKPKIIKIMKPLQKTVRYFSEDEKKDEKKNNPLSYLLALFPYVSKYSLKMNDIFYWRFLQYCPKIKNLQIELISPPDYTYTYYNYNHSAQLLVIKNNVSKLMLAFRKKFTQYFLQKQCVQQFTVKISPEFTEISKTFLDWLNEIKIYLPKLKSFHLDKVLGAQNFIIKPDKKQRISQEYLRYTTHLALQDVMSSQFCSPIGLEFFRNLISLDVSLSSDESVAKINQLIHLTSLKTLNLRVSVPYHTENYFLQKFVLPPNITKLRLSLQKFAWENVQNSKAAKKSLEEFFTSNPSFLRFSQQFKTATNLKSFTLNIMDLNTRGCSKIIGLLAVAIFKQISTLETLKYSHNIAPRREGQRFVPHSKDRPLSLGYFYQGLEPSKKSLQKIVIRAPQIAISDLSNLRKKLPKLQTISIQDIFWVNRFHHEENIIGANNIFNIWHKPSSTGAFSPLIVNIGEFLVCNDKKLKLYLDSLRSIPEDWDLTMKLNVSREVNEKTFCDEVKRFLEQVNPKNNLSLILNYNIYRGDQEFEDIKTAVTKTSALKFLKVKCRNALLFSSERGVIIEEN